MKNLLAILLTVSSYAAFCQNDTTVRHTTLRIGRTDGISPTYGYNYTNGLDLSLEHNLSSRTAIFVSPGYNMYHLNEGYIEDNLAYYTLKTGIKIFPKNKFYFSLAGGIAFGTKSEYGTHPFVFAPAIGLRASRFDFNLRYEHMTGRIVDYLDEIKRPGQIALNISYGFSVAKPNSAWLSTRTNLSTALDSASLEKSLYIEQGGNGINFSLNYDMRFTRGHKDGLGFRAGVGLGSFYFNPPVTQDYRYLTIPVALNYIVAKRRNGIEAGLGLTPQFAPNETNEPKWMMNTFFTLGYRFLPVNKGIMFRAMWTPSLLSGSGVVAGQYGVSIGYAFK